MELSQLRYFINVADKLSFSKAADELGVSQPGLSRAIAKLEESIGQPVFERQSRNLALTAAGQILLQRANQIIAIIDDTLSEISDQEEAGHLRVGAIPTIAPFFLPPLLKKFNEVANRSKVAVHEDTTDPTLHRLKQGELDLAILALPVEQKYLEVEPLFEEELLAVLPLNHPLVEKTPLQLDDLRQYPFVLLDEAHCLSSNIVTICQQKSFDPLTTERISQLATVQELVSLNHGISMIPQMAAAPDPSATRVYRALEESPRRTIAMVWNPYRYQNRMVDRFKKVVREFAASMAADNVV